MKILHLLHSFPPESNGGTETYVAQLARAQLESGDRALVVSGSQREGAQPIREPGRPEVLRLPHPPPEAVDLSGRSRGAREHLAAIAREERPDVLHLHHWHQLTTDAVACFAAAGVPTVVSLHDFYLHCPLFFCLPDDRHLCPPDVDRGTCARCVAPLRGETAEVLERAFGPNLAPRALASSCALISIRLARRDAARVPSRLAREAADRTETV